MCGIMASKGNNIIGSVLSGLKKLEYRGYDSCGVACKVNGKIESHKQVGYVDKLYEAGVDSISTSIAIGHTRWATHGKVCVENSHPHLSKSGTFAIVHNGIIENYAELKDEFLSDVNFVSQTDTEVVAQLIERFYKDDVWQAFTKVVSLIKGSFAIVMLNAFDNNLYFAKEGSPMVVAKGESAFAISSDINGFDSVSQVAYLNDGDIGYIDTNIHVFDRNLSNINVQYRDDLILINSESMGKYPHYMLKEINEIPGASEDCVKSILKCKFTLPRRINNILMISCGTSYHSSLMGQKYIETLVGIPVRCEIASEYLYNSNVQLENVLGIFVSQSGETADSISAMKKAKEQGVFTLAITNVRNSSMAQLADSVIYLNAGAEICVASTKAYTSQVMSMLKLTNILLNINNGNYSVLTKEHILSGNLFSNVKSCDLDKGVDYVLVDDSKSIDYLNLTKKDLEKLYKLDILAIDESVVEVAQSISKKKELLLIGKGYDYITALESSLKIKEVSYIFTDAYPCGELKHGTLSLIDDNSLVIAIATDEKIWDKVKNSIHEIVCRGGKVALITQMDIEDKDIDYLIKIPNVSELLLPIVSIIPIDLIAYRVSIMLGNNPDKPRNLAKSVTVE